MKGSDITLNAVVTEGQAAVNTIYTDCGIDATNPHKREHRADDHIVGKTDDVLELIRTAPKPNGDSYGSTRSVSRFRKSVLVENMVGDSVLQKAKIEISTSFPVGMSAAEIFKLKALAGAWLNHTLFNDLAVECQI